MADRAAPHHSDEPRTSSRPSRARSPIVVLGALVLLLALAEAGLRLAWPELTSGTKEGASLKQRVRALPPKAPGEYRVLALGNALSLDDANANASADEAGAEWTRILERRAKADGRALSLVSLSAPDTSARTLPELLEEYGREVEPDLVLVALSLGTDLHAYALDGERPTEGLHVEAPAASSSGSREVLTRTSALAAAVARAFEGSRSPPDALEPALARTSERLGLSLEELTRRANTHDPAIVQAAKQGTIDAEELAWALARPSRYADVLSLSASARLPAAVERLAADAAAIRALCEKLAATCAYVLLPVGLQVDERYHARFQALGYETAPWMARATPLSAALVPALRAKGVVVLDPLPALKAASAREARELYRANDTRLSDEGHRVVGDAVYEALRDMAAFDAERGPPTAREPKDPRVDALLAGSALEGASEDERRLALQIAALRKAREELRELLTSLPAHRELAERMQAEVLTLEKDLPPEAVKRALDDARARLLREGAPEGSALARAPSLERELERLLQKEPVAASDSETVRALKLELLREQSATTALATGASVAFRALRTLEEMKLALPELRRLHAAKR